MIYVAFEECTHELKSQRKAANKAKRLLLSAFGLSPDDITLTENGKPQIRDSRYHISVSHSAEVAVCALRCKEQRYDLPENVFTIFEDEDGDVGIDIEYISPEKELERLNRISMRFMRRKFSSVEKLIERWTLCEAYTKLHDVPLATSLKSHITDIPAYKGIVTVKEQDYYLTVLV